MGLDQPLRGAGRTRRHRGCAWHAFRSTLTDTKSADAENGTGNSVGATPES